jgi:hypothetical protein
MDKENYIVDIKENVTKTRNNSSWCCDQIEEKIRDYKLSLTETTNEEVKRQLKIIIDDLEEILYG